MKQRIPASAIAACAILSLSGAPAQAHRLDEYLQATLLSISKEEVRGQMRLTPGEAVLSQVLAGIDTDRDGAISAAEQQGYVRAVLQDVSLSMDGDPLKPRLLSMHFPDAQEMREGSGEILIEFSAALRRGGSHRKLSFENHHQSRIGAYLVNVLVPRDPGIQVVAQNRSYSQSFYEVEYTQPPDQLNASILRWWSGSRGWLVAALLTLLARVLLRLSGALRPKGDLSLPPA